MQWQRLHTELTKVPPERQPSAKPEQAACNVYIQDENKQETKTLTQRKANKSQVLNQKTNLNEKLIIIQRLWKIANNYQLQFK